MEGNKAAYVHLIC